MCAVRSGDVDLCCWMNGMNREGIGNTRRHLRYKYWLLVTLDSELFMVNFCTGVDTIEQ